MIQITVIVLFAVIIFVLSSAQKRRKLAKLPASFARWQEVDVIASSEYLHAGPSVLDITTYKQWLDAYARWQAGYDAYLKAAGALGDGMFTDDFDRRQYGHYT